MKTIVKIEGLRDLDRRLSDLSKAAARGVLRRVLMKAGQPIADAAKAIVARETGELHDSIIVSSRLKNTTGYAEFADVMVGGGTRAEARAAMLEARRAGAGKGSFAEVHVGPARARTKQDAIKRIVVEFGSVDQPPRPYMRPAWEQEKTRALDIIKSELGGEIDKSIARAARRAVRKAKG